MTSSADHSPKLSAADYRRALKQLSRAKPNKFHAIKKRVGGVTFASTREANRYSQLLLLESAGVIRGLRLQPTFPIFINGTKVFTYIGDFEYVENGEPVYEDAKGVRTAVYRLKKKSVEAYYGVRIKEV